MAKPSLDSFVKAPTGLDQFASVPTQPAASPQKSLSNSIWDTLGGVGDAVNSVFPGKEIGQDIVKAGTNIKNLVTGGIPKFNAGLPENTVDVPKLAGDVTQAAVLPASIGAAAPAGVADAALQYGGFGAASSAGHSLAEGNSAGQVLADTAEGAGIGAATGGIFNLIGKGISKVAAPVASVTSGVPKAAIEQAGKNPSVVKEGVGMNVGDVRTKAITSLQSLYNDLNKEHSSASSLLGDEAPANADKISSDLLQRAQNIAKQFKISVTPSAEGLASDFSKSAIVNPGEENTVKKALDTVNTWDDFSPKGLQALNQRVNALKNYDSAGINKSSAIVGKIHDSIGKIIESNSPELSSINSNFSTNKKVLDNIRDVIGADAHNPTQIQSSVTRLDNIFKENRDEYLNIIKQLGDRSGVDYLSLLAGGEFQKLLPGYLRSAVAVGSVGGVGSVAANPMSMLLLPLFSPRAVGLAARNAPNIADTTSRLVRAGASQAIPKIAPGAAPQ